MSPDLYDRLTEIQSILQTLGTDVQRLRLLLGDRSIQAAVTDEQYAHRRFYIRAVFALIEAVIEQDKMLVLDLAGRKTVQIDQGTVTALSEKAYAVTDKGTVVERAQYLQMEREVRAVHRAAETAFGQQLKVAFGDGGWESFQRAIKVRDRITHPKTYQDCDINGDDLDLVDRGEEWFRSLHNAFAGVVKAHSAQHRWGISAAQPHG